MSGRWNSLRSRLRPLLAPLGALALVLGERLLAGTPPAPWLSGLGVALLAASLLWSLTGLRGGGSPPVPLRERCWPVLSPALLLLAAAAHFGARALAGRPPGLLDWEGIVRWGAVLSGLAGAVLFVFVETALGAQRRTPRPDFRRLRAAGTAGLSLALLLLLAVSLNFIFARLPWQWNLAYFRTTEPSQATREVVAGLSEPVEAVAFFSGDSPVAPLVASYLRRLESGTEGSGMLRVTLADADLQPALAETFQARSNGTIVLRRGEVRANVAVGETLEKARRALGKLDESFFARLLEVSRERQTVYLTVGHGERNEHPSPTGPAAPSGLNRFQALLRARNFTVKQLGPAEGLGEGVPADAALVVAADPREPFLPGEGEALRRYLEGGGALLAFLEPSRPGGGRADKRAPAGTSLAQMLERFGILFDPTPQANDRVYGRRTFTQADHALLVTVRFLNHPSVEGLRRAGSQFPLLLLEAGALRAGQAPAGLQAIQTVQAMPGTWGDANGNFAFDAPEQRGEPALAVAVGPPAAKGRPGAAAETSAEGPRILAFADADLAGDLLLQNRANLLAVEEALAWLVKRPALPDLPASEEDVRLVHARADDWLWFYLPVLGIPLLVVGFGWLRVRRLHARTGGRHD